MVWCVDPEVDEEHGDGADLVDPLVVVEGGEGHDGGGDVGRDLALGSANGEGRGGEG